MAIRIKFIKTRQADNQKIPVWLEVEEKHIGNTEQFETMLEQLTKKGVQFYISTNNVSYLIADHDDGVQAVQSIKDDELIVDGVRDLIVKAHRKLIEGIEPRNDLSDVFEINFEKKFWKLRFYFSKTTPNMDWELGIKFHHGSTLLAVIFINFGHYLIRFGFH